MKWKYLKYMYAKEMKSYGRIRQHHHELKLQLFEKMEFLNNYSLNDTHADDDNNEEILDEYDHISNDDE